MRVFLTPQAFAGNIRSIEMFVLTPKPAAGQRLEIASTVEPRAVEPRAVESAAVESAAVEPSAVESSAVEPRLVEPSFNLTSDSGGKMLPFAAPAPAVANRASERLETIRPLEVRDKVVSAAVREDFADGLDAWDEPGFASVEEIAPVAETRGGIGRAILASKQSAWPDMAAMKLVPAELAPAPVRPAVVSPPSALQSERVAARSTGVASSRDKRFWRVPIVAGMTAVLALSAVWMTNHFSASSTSEGTTLQHMTTPPAEPANPGTAGAQLKAIAKPLGTSAPTRMRAKAKRRTPPESDYVAKDTTVYFSKRPAALLSSKKPQARP
jgi:hypothetical protein